MATGNYQFQSEFARKHQAQGKALGESAALLAVLKARGLDPTPEERSRIVDSTDHVALLRWVGKAVSVTSVAQLFED